MQLWILRHAEAVPHASRADSDRELTPRGEHQAVIAGRALARISLELTACYSSPKVRARRTAELACQELGATFQEVSAMAAGFDAGDCRAILHAHGGAEDVMFVGHEPDLSQLVHDLTGARIDLGKGAVAAVRLEGGSGELVALLRPRDLEAMAAPAGAQD